MAEAFDMALTSACMRYNVMNHKHSGIHLKVKMRTYLDYILDIDLAQSCRTDISVLKYFATDIHLT